MNKVERHMDICKDLNKIYEQKNHDYGDSFHNTFVEEGAAMARIRLSDKLNRFKKLSMTDSEQKVNDESIRDTLLDLANYAIMTVMEMDILAEEDKRVRLGEELSKMKDEWEAARIYRPFKDDHIRYACGKPNTDPDPCEKCTYPGKTVCISMGGCVDHAEWEKRQMDAVDIQEEEDKTFRIPENLANSGEYFCPNCGNKLAFNPKIDKYICGGCGTIYSITAK